MTAFNFQKGKKLGREGLMEKAAYLLGLRRDKNMTYKQIAEKVGISSGRAWQLIQWLEEMERENSPYRND